MPMFEFKLSLLSPWKEVKIRNEDGEIVKLSRLRYKKIKMKNKKFSKLKNKFKEKNKNNKRKKLFKQYKEMTIHQLKEFALKEDISLKGISRKQDIINKIIDKIIDNII